MFRPSSVKTASTGSRWSRWWQRGRLARLARAEPDGAKTTGPAALARGLASIAGAANVANDRFPMPLPRDNSVAAYPKLAYEPRQATVRAKGKLSVLKIGSRQFKRLIGVLEFDKVY